MTKDILDHLSAAQSERLVAEAEYLREFYLDLEWDKLRERCSAIKPKYPINQDCNEI